MHYAHLRKCLSVVVISAILSFSPADIPAVYAADNAALIERIAALETDLGVTSENDALIGRVSALEEICFGSAQSGSLNSRIQSLEEAVYGIPSGGQSRSEPMAEAEAMYRYIISTGFPENCVIREDQSANTFQNMAFSKRIIDEQTGDSDKAKIAFATTNYHVFRSGIWSNLAGLRAEGIGSRTKWWFWPNAFIRECIALLKNRLVPELLFLMGLAVVAGLFTWLSFL